jgi:glycosyltransferase involved in cell wall biosynthesis
MFNDKTVSLVLPTYNEKDSIKECIKEFEALGIIDEIIVINNNAAEGTSEEVAQTSAIEIFEDTQGYGSAVLRGYKESTCDLVVLCEPDATFLTVDIFKLLEFSRDFDVVYGSRTCHALIWDGANMGYFLRTGNWAVAKLLELLYVSVSLSDVGCTYRLINRKAKEVVLKECNVTANYFSPEMMITTIKNNFKVVQVPVNYKDRVGISMGSGTFWKAFKIGMGMIFLIIKKRLTSS